MISSAHVSGETHGETRCDRRIMTTISVQKIGKNKRNGFNGLALSFVW
jgi:hypothetical protein